MEEYIVKDGKKLRLGYTTGSCAAAAAKAAAYMLLTGRRKDTIDLLTPKGIRLHLTVEEIKITSSEVSCAIRKDSGDDPDATRGTLIFACVRKTDVPEILIDGGAGVGRVTKRGLDQPVGAAAINSVPRRMIEENVREVCALCGYDGGVSVVISVPEGEALAKKTFNPRLGIVGGISILGTTGIVEPMSEQALVDTIRRAAAAAGTGRGVCSSYAWELRRGFYPGFHRHRPPNGGPDQQFYRRRAGTQPGAGLSWRASHRPHWKAREAGGRHVEHALEIRRLPYGASRRPRSIAWPSAREGLGAAVVRHVRRRASHFTRRAAI